MSAKCGVVLVVVAASACSTKSTEPARRDPAPPASAPATDPFGADASPLSALTLDASTFDASTVDAAPLDASSLDDAGALPGTCRDPFAHQGVARDAMSAQPRLQFDLDGDGTKDFVIFVSGERQQAIYALYVRRGDCGHYVGRVNSATGMRALGSKSNGLADLRLVWDIYECERNFKKSSWCAATARFDGKQYKPIAVQEIDRPAGTF